MTDRIITVSRRMSYVLRHNPSSIGLTLDEHGWVEVDELLRALAAVGLRVTHTDLAAIVAGTDKKRFEVSGTRIRAAQGHSVAVDLGLEAQRPPDVLWHGTVERFMPSIMRDGLRPQGRRHVHLSPDPQTAYTVGERRGRPVILEVDAATLHKAGQQFYLAANGIWLTAAVPPGALTRTQ